MDCEQFASTFASCTKSLDEFLSANKDYASTFTNLTKAVYDHAKTQTASSSNEQRSKFDVNGALKALLIDRFDEQQIWEELQLENMPFLRQVIKPVSKLSAKKLIHFNLVQTRVEPVPNTDESSDDDDEPVPKKTIVRFAIPKKKPLRKKPKLVMTKIKESIVDDKFFKLSELEEFLNLEDKKEEVNTESRDDDESDEDEDDIDLFESMSTESDEDNELVDEDIKKGRRAMYQNFFDRPRDELVEGGESGSDGSGSDDESEEIGSDEFDDRDVENDDETMLNKSGGYYNSDSFGDHDRILEPAADSDSDDGESVENILGANSDRSKTHQKSHMKSDFEKEQEVIKDKIQSLEKESLTPKPWQLGGEALSDNRPENSLLQEHLQFDHVTREAPMITEETTLKLEDIILQRIKNASFDDVERKVKPTEQPFEFKRRITLNQEKGKANLAEVYEKEYLKQTQENQTEEENAVHKEIRLMTKNLFLQLDALSNFSFTPRPPEPEVKVINNLPAISAEETIPTAVSDAALLAPEEISGKRRGEVKTKSEKSAEDRKRERRLKKANQGTKRKHREAQEKLKQTNPGLGNKYSKLAKQKELAAAKKSSLTDDDAKAKEIGKLTKNALKSSKSFFATLQDAVHQASEDKGKKDIKSNPGSAAAQRRAKHPRAT